MKKVIFLALFSIGIATMANAQVKFGVHVNGIGAGGKIENTDEGETIKVDLKTRLSWKAGAVAFIPISSTVSFVPQLNIVSKGGKMSDEYSESNEGVEYRITAEGKTQLSYLEMPLNIAFTTRNFWFGLGPSLSYGIGGNAKNSITISADGKVIESTEEESKVKFDGKSSNDDQLHLKAFELGGNLTAGYQFKNGLFVQANFNLGLSNISPEEGSTGKNRYFGLGIGYLFKK